MTENEEHDMLEMSKERDFWYNRAAVWKAISFGLLVVAILIALHDCAYFKGAPK